MKSLKNKFRRKNKLDALLIEALDCVSTEYMNRADIQLSSHIRRGDGVTLDSMSRTYPLPVVIGVGDMCVDVETCELKSSVKLSDLVPVVVAMFHEGQHVHQFGEVHNNDSVDMQYMALNHLSCHGAPMYGTRNRCGFVTEIDAECAGIGNAGAFLTKYFNDAARAEGLLLDYVNARIDFGGYFIKPPKEKAAYDNLDDVFDAFDAVCEDAKHVHRDYLIHGCTDSNYQFMQDNMTGSARDMLYLESDGFKQDAMMSAIVLYQHPEYKGWHKSLQDMDLSMETMFGENWQRIDKPKSVRRLPDVSIETYGQSSQYEP